jgi:hypothetical protein
MEILKMDGTELVNIDSDMDQLVAAFDSDNTEALMKFTGQAEQKKTGLPRLNINYNEETDDGISLKRGTWKIYVDGEFLYAPEVYIRPILRTFEWSAWDQEEQTFSSKSVQKPVLSGSFPDTTGTDRCGRLSRDEEESLGKDDPALIRSRMAVCNQIIYGLISGTFTKADGTEVELDNSPFVSYFKKSGFMPIRNFIESLTKQNKVMQRCNILLRTAKKTMGATSYFVPVPTLAGEIDISDSDKEMMKMFVETVKGHNEVVMNQHRDAVKLLDDSDIDLADDFKDAASA